MRVKRFEPSRTALVLSLLALLAVAGNANAIVTNVVPLAKRALVADNAKKLNGLSATQLAGASTTAAVRAALVQSPAGPRPASTAAGLVTIKSRSFPIGANSGVAATVACDAGQQVMGGGSDSDVPGVLAFRSFPADSATWKLLLFNLEDNLTANVTIYATCLR
jgi:hypothetical protein